MTVPTITPPPPAPVRNDQPTFSDRVAAFLTWLVAFVTELVSLSSWMDGTADEVQTNADAAASAAAAALGAANYKGEWSSLAGALPKPASASNGGNVYLLLNDLADVTASEPGVTADWALLTAIGVTRFKVYPSAVSLTLAVRDFVTLTAAGKAVTLPPDPPLGAECGAAWGAWTDTTLDGNGQNIIDADGVARTDFALNVPSTSVQLLFTSQGWIFQ